MQSYTHTN